MVKFRRSVKSKLGGSLMIGAMLLLLLPGMSSAYSRETTTINIIAKTLQRMGETTLAQRLIQDHAMGLVQFGNLEGKGVNAETGLNKDISMNVMILDNSAMTLADMERIWQIRPYSSSVPDVSWAATVFHEYVHMNQLNPQNTPAFEDITWQNTDQALVKWYLKIFNEYEALKNDSPSGTRGDKLQELEDILKQLKGEIATWDEAVQNNIANGSLSRGLPFQYPGLVNLIEDTLKDVGTAIQSNKSALSGTGTAGGTTGGSGGSVFPKEPFNGMQITYNISGASISGSTDSEGFTTSRTLSGTLGSGPLHVSGSAKMGNGFGADLNITVTVDGNSQNFKAYLQTPASGGFAQQSFDVTVPIPAGAKYGSIDIGMTGQYNVGTRGLVVSGSFAGQTSTGSSGSSGTFGTSGASGSSGGIGLYLNGQPMQLDVPPMIIDGRTMMPAWGLIQAIGGKVEWNGGTKQVKMQCNGHTIVLKLDNKVAQVDSKSVNLDVPATVVNGRTLIPVSFVARNLGLNVSWDATNRRVNIVK